MLFESVMCLIVVWGCLMVEQCEIGDMVVILIIYDKVEVLLQGVDDVQIVVCNVSGNIVVFGIVVGIVVIIEKVGVEDIDV